MVASTALAYHHCRRRRRRRQRPHIRGRHFTLTTQTRIERTYINTVVTTICIYFFFPIRRMAHLFWSRTPSLAADMSGILYNLRVCVFGVCAWMFNQAVIE